MMSEHMGNEKTSCHRGVYPFGPNLPTVDVTEVNDDPAQILDVLTRSEQEDDLRGAEIDVSRFVYDAPSVTMIGEDALDRLLADAADEVIATTAKERELHEYN